MANCLNAVGFVFDKVKTSIKKDIGCKYTKYYCQQCMLTNETKNGYGEPVPGMMNPCNNCSNNTQYKICIFKLKKEHFISSSLGICSNAEEAWNIFKNAIIYQRNGNFVISITDKCNKSHSFYANLIKAKNCTCCEAVILYFKYNIISMLPTYKEYAINNPPPDVKTPQNYPYTVACANINSNITYNLKSCEYKNVRFFISQNYQFNNNLEPCGICT